MSIHLSHFRLTPQILKTLIEYLEELQLSKSYSTVEGYSYDISKFIEYMLDQGMRRLATLKSQNIISYLTYCKDYKSEATINRYYMSLRSFCAFLLKRKYIKEDIIEEITVPAAKQKAPKILTEDEIEALISATDLDTEAGLRDRAILELFYSSGLRVSELCDLSFEDISANSVRIVSGKGSKTRTIPMTHGCRKWIDQYIEKYRGKEEGYLFLTLQGKKLNRHVVFKMVAKNAQKAGLERTTPHSLRHACATHLLDSGAELFKLLLHLLT